LVYELAFIIHILKCRKVKNQTRMSLQLAYEMVSMEWWKLV